MTLLDKLVKDWYVELGENPDYNNVEHRLVLENILRDEYGIDEARIFKDENVPGIKLLVKDPSEKFKSKGLKSGMVVTIVNDKEGPADIGNGSITKTVQLPDGKLVKLAGEIGTYGNYFTEFKGGKGTPSGAEWESLIVSAYNKQYETGTGAEWKISERFWESFGEIAIKISDDLSTKISSKQLTQMGSSRSKLNPKWLGTDTTPKTDIIGSNEKISLKKSGGSQLMSSAQAETISTFNAAMEIVGQNKPQGIHKFINDLEQKMGRVVTDHSITNLKKLSTSGEELSPEDARAVGEMETLQLNAKELMASMNELFKDKYFKQCFCFEAATGYTKFNNSDASANLLVSFNIGSGKIEKTLPINKIEDVSSIASSTSFYISFKSSGKNPYLALRTKFVKESFRDIIFNEINKTNVGQKLLSESSFQQLNEFQLFNKLVKGVKNLGSKAKNVISKIIDNIIKKISKVLDGIKKLGKDMFNGVLDFLGFSVSDIKISSGGTFPVV